MANASCIFSLKNKFSSVGAYPVLAGYPENNCINGIPAETYRSGTNEATTTVQFSETVDVTAVAIINHNIPESSTLEVFFSDDGVNWGDPIALTWLKQNIWQAIEGEGSYMKLEVIAPVGTDTIEIGEFFPGTIGDFPVNFKTDYTHAIDQNMFANVVNGQVFQDSIGFSGAQWKLNFVNVAAGDLAFYRQLHQVGYYVFIFDRDQPQCYHGCFLGKFEAQGSIEGYSFSLNFLENPPCLA